MADDLLQRFEDADLAERRAHAAWGEHADNCPDCARSVFACREGQRLSEASNSAWCEAKRLWDELKERNGA